MAETGNTTRTQLINLEGLSAFLDESKKIFEPTLPTGTNGQVLKLSGGKPTWRTDNTPTAFKWTNGTTAGPTGSLTGNGMSAVSFGAIPSAGASASGVVTTGAQTFAGKKTFNSTIGGSIDGNAATATSADKTAHSLSVKDGAATPAAAINSWNGSTDKTLTIKGESPVTTTATDGKITVSHNNSGVTAGTYKSVTVDAKGHVTAGTNPTTLSGYGITDAKIANGTITLGSGTITPLTSASTLAAGKVSGTLATSNIPNLDASKITTGTISVDRLPATALERCVVVANDTARFKLTTSSVQVGDTVKVTATKKMYMVVDSSKLSSEAGYEEYFTSTDWSTITNKPTSFTPATHSHDAATQSANGFMSAADKKKLDGIATGANKYTHPTHTAQPSGLYKITVDGTGHVSAATAVVKSDITALGIPGADTTNVTSTTTGSGNAVTSVTANGSSITVTKGTTFLTAHQDISGKLDKINVEYNKEIAMGSSGYICIGKFPCYDSNITIYIDSSTSTTYHGVLIIATQNINSSGEGVLTAHTYGDVSNTLTPALKLEYNSGSNSVNVYFQPQPWSKNLFHIRCNALAGTPTDIATSVSSIPATANRAVTNLLKSALDGKAASSHTHTKSQITDFPTKMPASDVYDWAKAKNKPSYSWSEITSKPTSFTPASHTHTKSQITDFPTKMPASDVHDWAKAENKPSYSWSEITSKPSSFTPASHTHTKSQITDFPTSMPASDVHDWAKAKNKPSYAWSEITNKPTSFAPASHTHTKSQITDFPTSMPASDVYSWAKAENKPSYAWSEITNKPSSFTPASHAHSDATTSASGFMSSTDKAKLNGIASGAEVNQNAFSNVTVGSTTISADSKTDTLTLTAGNNITLTPDAANDKITISSSYVAASASTSGIVTTEAQAFAGAKTFNDDTNSNIERTTGAVIIKGGLSVAKDIYANAVHNAVWNDLVDCIPVDNECKVEPGYCYCFDGEKYYKSIKYLDEGIVGIDSDTYGMSMGRKPDLNQMDVAVAGFVLAYVDKEYKPGTPLTCTENGYLTKIKLKDKIRYPERIVATYWKSEPADEWGSDSRRVKVNGRKWVKVV